MSQPRDANPNPDNKPQPNPNPFPNNKHQTNPNPNFTNCEVAKVVYVLLNAKRYFFVLTIFLMYPNTLLDLFL